MYGAFKDHLRAELDGIAEAGLTKNERGILGPQGPEIAVGESRVLNFCANNYVGLADDPSILAAAHEALDEWGYGLASVGIFGFTCALLYASTGSLGTVIAFHMLYNTSIKIPEWIVYHAPLG